MKASEPEVREMLQRRAGDFRMQPDVPVAVLKRARRRKAKSLMLAGTTLMTIVGLALFSAVLASDLRQAGGLAATGAGSSTKSTAPLEIVSYVLGDTVTVSPHPHDGTGPLITVDALRKHAECMREQGFDIPNPTETADGNWSLIVQDPTSVGLDLNDPAFRQAMFVTCGPLGGPLTGDLVIAGSRDRIDGFRACMAGQGFDLPEPTRDATDDFDADEWDFDLGQTHIDTSSSDWNRAMFVTCGGHADE